MTPDGPGDGTRDAQMPEDAMDASGTIPADSGRDAAVPSGPGAQVQPKDAGGAPVTAPSNDANVPIDPAAPLPPDPEGCNGIYAQDLLPTFEIKLAPADWEALKHEWNTGAATNALGEDATPYHPVVEFRYGDIAIETAEIRLRGNPDFWEPLPNDKMQFQFRFRTKAGRFLGLKRLVLEAATYNRHMLRDRLALSVMRDVGIKAPCANHARLVVNGDYYGLFTNIEKIDKTFLRRNYAYPDGDLWKRANWEIKTNEDTATTTRLLALQSAKSAATLSAYLDMAPALRLFAAEAVIPDSDGIWAGGLNFYVYDDPETAKFEVLPWDMDNTFDRFNGPADGDYPMNPDPITWEKPTTHDRPWYDVIMADPELFDAYVKQVEAIVAQGYVPTLLHERIDTWTDQIREAALADTNKPYDNALYLQKVQELHEYVDARHAYLVAWLGCWQAGGKNDGSGHCTP